MKERKNFGSVFILSLFSFVVMNKILDANKNIEKLLAEKTENLKELACINQIHKIIWEAKSIEEVLQKIVSRIPQSMKYSGFSEAAIIYGNKEYKSFDFNYTKWYLSSELQTIDDQKVRVTVYYLKQFPEAEAGPFLIQEKKLIENITDLVVGFLNGVKARQILQVPRTERQDLTSNQKKNTRQLTTQQLLQKFLDRHNMERDLFHELMPFKVKEILLIATLYDAYIIEGEGRFSDHILGEYSQMNLVSMPRVTGVSSEQEALKRLKKKHFDIIIFMVGVDKKNPVKIAEKIKNEYPYIPTFLLLNNNSDIAHLEAEFKTPQIPENLFVWNGDSKVFFAMVKLLEDMVNAGNDTKLGVTKIILLVEDDPSYYSKYLSILYSLVLDQTRHLIEDVGADDLYKALKIRTRPKILLAKTYNEAINYIKEFGDDLLCVVSDVRFKKNKILSETAGFELIKYVKSRFENLPIVLQSSDPGNKKQAEEMGVHFMNKNSETLAQDLKYFINYYLGFGHFVYRDNRGRKIAVARSMKEFEVSLRTIPADSLIYHAMKNHFSMWLMARGEVEIAKMIYPLKVGDFKSLNEMREALINIIRKRRQEKNRGKIVNFEESAILDETNIVRMATGSLGGKGRGLAFVNTLIYNFNFSNLIPDINIRTPKTVIIGTNEFDAFLERNQLHDIINKENNYSIIQKHFLSCDISDDLKKKLKIFLKLIDRPIAIRSSSLLEDSINQPFSGIFNTFLLPNNHPDFKKRFKQAIDAIKMVYASIYSDNARSYFKAINFKAEDEKMAIVVQEVVGQQHDSYYYPHISGTAQSHNFYPYAHMKPEEGFAVAALGLGYYVVEGEKSYRFSPAYPNLEINTPKYLFKNSQVWFYAIDLLREKIDLKMGDLAGLIKIDISKAEKHNTLKHAASVYLPDDDRLEPGLEKSGPRIINFANILKYNYIPLAQTISILLDVVKEALGSPVEIEYAVDMNKDQDGKVSFYLLQVKPLIGADADFTIDLSSVDKEKVILYAEKSMGNGTIQELTDVIFVVPERFNKNKTIEMADEIDRLNAKMVEEKRKYILVGPGRWGTRDRFIGIPVVWPQISNAKVIVEISLRDFPLDASLGSHFFHSVISMNVGYFSVNHATPGDFISWEILYDQDLVEETKYFKHVRFKSKLLVQMDGKNRTALISLGK